MHCATVLITLNLVHKQLIHYLCHKPQNIYSITKCSHREPTENSECFIVTFVEQPSHDYLDICEDEWLNKISASINKHRIILPRIK